MVQLSVLKIVGYGPWTLTLGSDREHELQMLQASLYARVQGLFSERQGLVFANRSDELFALSTGIGLGGHTEIQDLLMSEFDVRLRVAVGCGSTPAEADRAARDSVLSEKGGSVLSERHNIFGVMPGDGTVGPEDESIIMHMDVDGLSKRHASPYETSVLMLGLHRKMSEYFYQRYDSLAFFMGGDNFMIISSERAAGEGARGFVDMVALQDGIQLNCGVGRAHAGREAARRATESLDMIRKMRDKEGDDDDDGVPRVYEHSAGQRP